MFPDNSWYGHRYIFSKYCKNKDYKIPFSIQHGSITTTFDKNFGRIIFPIIKFLVWNKKTSNICKKNGFNRHKIIGAPFIYLNELLKKKKYKTDRDCLVFIPHAAEGLPGPFDHKDFLDYAKKKIKGKITACFFYAGITKDLVSLYKKNKIKVVTCGKRHNKYYLFLLYKLYKTHKKVIITELGSPMFYSLFLKKPTDFIGKFTPLNTGAIQKRFKKQYKSYRKRNHFLFKEKSNNKLIDQNKGKAFANNELGYQYLQSKKRLSELLYSNNIFMKFYAEICSFLLYMKWKNRLLK